MSFVYFYVGIIRFLLLLHFTLYPYITHIFISHGCVSSIKFCSILDAITQSFSFWFSSAVNRKNKYTLLLAGIQ